MGLLRRTLFQKMEEVSKRTTLTLLICLGWLITHSHEYGIQEYCEGETFEGKCKNDEVVVMKSAYYGRMRLGRCVRMNMGYIGCEEDVLDLADMRCSGKSQCKIKVPDTNFERTQPCFELKSYLEIEYSCLKVATARPQVCRTAKYVKLTSPTGYLASSVTQTSGCGSSSCPWVIEVPAGQKINLTLVDFGWRARQSSLQSENILDTLQVCQKYAVLRELGTTKSITICGSAERESSIYISESNQVELYLTPKMASDGSTMHFLLKYEAIGCPDLTPPKNAFVRRHQDGSATVQCKYSGQSWKINCKGMQWYGSVGNCTHYTSHTAGRFVIGNVSMPHGIAFAIVAGVAIVIGAFILTAGLVMFKRHKRKYGECHQTQLRPGSSSTMPRPSRRRPEDFLPPPPLPDIPGNHHLSPTSKYPTNPRSHSKKNDYTHIWEMPLPLPNEQGLALPPNVAIPVTYPTCHP